MMSEVAQGRFQELMREFRRRAGLTQQEAARRAGVSTGALRDLEQGRVLAPRAGTIRRLAGAFDLSEAETSELAHVGTSSAGFRIEVLGSLAVVVDGVAIDMDSTIQRTLLAMLALSPDTSVTRDALIEVVWAASPPANAVDLLQSHVSRLRRRLASRHGAGGRIVVATQGGYRLRVDEHQIDLLEFRRLAGHAHQAEANGDVSGAFDLYGRAAALWRGQPVDDVPDLHAHPTVVRIAREWQRLVLEYAVVAASVGRSGDVLPHLERLAEVDPLHEAAHAQLMIAMAGTGQHAAALEVFDKLRRRLAEEVGADPGPELTETHRRVLRHDTSAPVTARRQLPPDIRDFTGRHDELRFLHNELGPTVGSNAAVVIAVIEGMAGIGKTKLAVHLAHQLVAVGRFTDTQLYVDLHGHADEPAADPGDVLASFLHLLGVPGWQIPPELEAKAALYRDRLSDRNGLVVLDNAASEDQVRPLLPAGSGGLVLITTRSTFALDGARPLHLDVFDPDDAKTLLARIAGTDRVEAENAGTQELIRYCGRLPLAIALAGRRLQTRPGWQIADLTERLKKTNARLDELAVGTRHLRAVFDLSYRALPDSLAAIFRRLGLHPGDDFTGDSAAALIGHPPAQLRQHLDRLVDEHLLTMASPHRYGFHDLLHEYARELAHEHDSPTTIRTAVDGVLRWYLYAADTANDMFPHSVKRLVLDERQRPPDLPGFDDENEVFGWFTAESANIIAVIKTGIESGSNELAWRLAVIVSRYYEHTSQVDAWLRTCHLGVTAARNSEDAAALVQTLTTLGIAYGKAGDLDRAIECFVEGEVTSRTIDDAHVRARVVRNLGIAYMHYGKPDEAIPCLHEALDLHQQIDDSSAAADGLSNLGWAYGRAGQTDVALHHLGQALSMRKSLDNPYSEAATMYHLGETLLHGGRPDEAVYHYRQLLDFFQKRREATDQYRAEEADAQEALGRALHAVGNTTEARECWRQAMTILADAGHPEANVLRGWLARPPDQGAVLPSPSEYVHSARES